VNSSSRVVLHEADTKFLRWFIPFVMVIGCVIAGNIAIPLLRPDNPFAETEPGRWLSIGIAVLAALAVPVGGWLIFLLFPQVTTTLDPLGRVVVMEYRRPLGRSVREYALDDIAAVKAVWLRRRSYTLVLSLKTGKDIRLDYFAQPKATREQQAAKIRAQLAPYWASEPTI
jgi:hypothetical protein